MSGSARRGVWQWAVAVWLAAVAVGGGLTLWLRDSAEPPPPTGWEKPEPSLSPSVGRYWPTGCPTPTAAEGPVRIVCVVSTG